MSVWNSLWRSNYSFETSAYMYFEVLLQPQSLSTLLIVGSSPPGLPFYPQLSVPWRFCALGRLPPNRQDGPAQGKSKSAIHDPRDRHQVIVPETHLARARIGRLEK